MTQPKRLVTRQHAHICGLADDETTNPNEAGIRPCIAPSEIDEALLIRKLHTKVVAILVDQFAGGDGTVTKDFVYRLIRLHLTVLKPYLRPREAEQSPKTITIHIEGGLFQDVTGIPPGYGVHIHDHDEGDTSHPSWNAEKGCFVTVYGGDGV